MSDALDGSGDVIGFVAGININDGFAGGNLMEGNLVLNMVRETGDHGECHIDSYSFIFALT